MKLCINNKDGLNTKHEKNHYGSDMSGRVQTSVSEFFGCELLDCGFFTALGTVLYVWLFGIVSGFVISGHYCLWLYVMSDLFSWFCID